VNTARAWDGGINNSTKSVANQHVEANCLKIALPASLPLLILVLIILPALLLLFILILIVIDYSLVYYGLKGPKYWF
jgi:hypothetical protein